MNVTIILGTAREGRRSEKVAKLIEAYVKNAGNDVTFVDVRDYPITVSDNSGENEFAKRFVPIIKQTDAFVWVCPEYNHSYPGEFKQLVDLAYPQYAGRPVMLCGVSNGPWGGTRAIEALRLLAVNFHMVPTGEPMMFPLVDDYFNTNGTPKDKALFEKNFKRAFAALEWYAKALKVAREGK